MTKRKDFFLFRVNVTTSPQPDLFVGDKIDRAEVLVSATLEAKNSVLKHRNWSIGNLDDSEVGHQGVFCFGRVSTFNKPIRDGEAGDYQNRRDIKNPFARIIFDYDLGVIAIEKNSDLSSDINRVAKVLERLLSSAAIFVEKKLDLSIRHVPDGESLIDKIKTSFRIRKFSVRFTRVNPRNLNRVFHQIPKLQLERIGGEEGELTFRGGVMDRDLMVDVTKSARLAANDIVVTYVDKERATAKTEYLSKGGITKFDLPDDFSVQDGLKKIVEAYSDG